VRYDFGNRMWKAVRFRVRLVGGEAVEDRASFEMEAFTREYADQQTGVVGPVECCHLPTVFRLPVRAGPLRRSTESDSRELVKGRQAARPFDFLIFATAPASICRTRSRVSDRRRPISSSVYSRSVPRP
jgi:hypothetical protein